MPAPRGVQISIAGTSAATVTGSNDVSGALDHLAAVGGGELQVGTGVDSLVGGINLSVPPTASGDRAVVVGRAAAATAADVVVLGNGAAAGALRSVVLGLLADCQGAPDAVIIGNGAGVAATSVGDGAIAIGKNATSHAAGAESSVVIGADATSGINNRGVVLGNAASITGQGAVAIGYNSSSNFGVSIGANAANASGYAVVIGESSVYTASTGPANEAGVVIGIAASSAFSRSVVVGSGSTVTGANATVLGRAATAADSAVAIGAEASAAHTSAIAIGRLTKTTEADQMAYQGRSLVWKKATLAFVNGVASVSNLVPAGSRMAEFSAKISVALGGSNPAVPDHIKFAWSVATTLPNPANLASALKNASTEQAFVPAVADAGATLTATMETAANATVTDGTGTVVVWVPVLLGLEIPDFA